MIRRRTPKKKLMIYTIVMSVMFTVAGIIFYRTYAPYRGGGSSGVIEVNTGASTTTMSQPETDASQLQQPFEQQQAQSQQETGYNGELLENPFFADRVSVPGFKPVTQGVAQVVDDTQALPVGDVKAFNIGTGADVLITWNDSADKRVEDIAIYRSQDASSLGEVITTIKPGKQTYRDRDVNIGMIYYYTVGSRAQLIQEGLSAQVSVIVEDTVPPPSVHTVSVAVTKSRGVHIEWQSVDDSSVVQYRIYRSQTSGILGDEIATVAADQPLLYDDTLVVSGTIYYYAVVAIDASGNSSTPRQLRPNVGNPYPFGR